MVRSSTVCRLVAAGIFSLAFPMTAYADLFFGVAELRQIADLFAREPCTVSCRTEKWSIRPVPFPSVPYAKLHPEETLFLVIEDKPFCGSAGCPGAYLLIDATTLTNIKEGFRVGTGELLATSDIPPKSIRSQLPSVEMAVSSGIAGGNQGVQATGLSSAAILSRIEKGLSRLPKPSAYLYETTTVTGAIASTWTEMTARILGTSDLRVAYDNFYQSSVEYAGLVEINLRRAKTAVLNNDSAAGSRLLEVAQRYERQFYLNDRAAIEVYNGNIAATAELAKGIYEGSKAAVIYGTSMVMGPVGSRVVDAVFDVTDFAVETSDNGLSSAAKQLVAGKITEMIFSHVPVATLNGKTLKDTIDRGVTKTLGNSEIYTIVRQAVSTPEFTKTFMSFMAKSGSYAATKVTSNQINKVVEAILNESQESAYCGSTDLQKLAIPEYVCYGLEGSTLPYATCATGTLVGWRPVYFGAACRAHDECYSRKGAIKLECDSNFESLLRSTCDETLTGDFRKLSRTNCYNTASEYYHQVDTRGCEAFKNAQTLAGIRNPSCNLAPDTVNVVKTF